MIRLDASLITGEWGVVMRHIAGNAGVRLVPAAARYGIHRLLVRHRFGSTNQVPGAGSSYRDSSKCRPSTSRFTMLTSTQAHYEISGAASGCS